MLYYIYSISWKRIDIAHHASFPPFVLSVDGWTGWEARVFTKCLAKKLAMKLQRFYREVMGWVQTWMSFVILRATNWCIQGSRVNWRSGLGMDDGAGLAIVMQLTNKSFILFDTQLTDQYPMYHVCNTSDIDACYHCKCLGVIKHL